MRDPEELKKDQEDRAGASALEVVERYLTAFYRGDFEAARPLVSDGLLFRGPFLQVDGADAFFRGAEGLRRIVRGHRTLRQWQDGGDVCSMYELDIETPIASGSVLMSEWDTVRDGLVAGARVVFDTAAFRALVPQAGASGPS
jgi:hypothetical protein